MHKKYLLSLALIVFISCTILAQNIVKGKIIDVDKNAIAGAELFSKNEELLTTTNLQGEFEFTIKSSKKQKIFFRALNFQESSLTIDPKVKKRLTVVLEPAIAEMVESDFAIITLSDVEVNDGNSVQNVSSILQASRDVFANLTTFQFNVARFNGRGLDGAFTRTLLNGMPVNDLDDGRVNWSYWGGLNDVLRNTQSTYGLDESEYTFGDIGGSQNIDLRASFQRKQNRPSIAVSNRTYRNRVMYTYSTGIIDDKYAISASASKRWGNEGYIDATFYDAYSYFLSFDYIINKSNTLNFVALGAPAKRGRGGASVQELNDIAGSNFYNSYWGYQNGEKRNSRIYNSFQPIFMLRHDSQINKNLNLSSTLSFQTGRFGSSRLDWYNVSDPRPDYYRNLPSFYKDSPEIADYITDQLAEEKNRQIDWDYMYFINKNTTEDFVNANGVEGAIQSGHRAKYILAEQRFDVQKLNFNSSFKYNVSNNLNVNGGLLLLHEVNHNFESILDLLGGDYYVDIDKFAERDFAANSDEIQNDLNNPNRIVFAGDQYGFNYNTATQQGSFWSQGSLKTKQFDAFVGGEIKYTKFWREGFTKNGKFPDNSFGKSQVNSFLNYAIRGGLSYKIDGRNYVNLISTYLTKAPFARYAFVSPRTRNDVVSDLTSSEIFSSELSYNHKSPILKAKFSAHFTTIKNQTEVNSFYHDEFRGFVNFILTDIDERHMGVEIAADLKLTSTLSAVGAAAIGENIYTSRPTATISQDNNAMLLNEGLLIYQKNFYIPNTPQQAYTVGLKYNSPKFWFVNLNFNFFNETYLDFNPTRRTEEAVANLNKSDNTELWENILYQEKIPSNYTADLFGGKSWKIGDKFIYLTVGVNNFLNNENFIIGGYEQSRFDFENLDVDRFPPRYFYAFGANYYIGLSFRL